MHGEVADHLPRRLADLGHLHLADYRLPTCGAASHGLLSVEIFASLGELMCLGDLLRPVEDVDGRHGVLEGLGHLREEPALSSAWPRKEASRLRTRLNNIE